MLLYRSTRLMQAGPDFTNKGTINASNLKSLRLAEDIVRYNDILVRHGGRPGTACAGLRLECALNQPSLHRPTNGYE